MSSVTVTIEYPIVEAFIAPQNYGGRDPEVVDKILRERYKIRRVSVYDENDNPISSEVTVIGPSDALADPPEIRDIVRKAVEKEMNTVWNITLGS